MKIVDLAKRADCSVETIRFYEREGLLQAPVCEDNGIAATWIKTENKKSAYT